MKKAEGRPTKDDSEFMCCSAL